MASDSWQDTYLDIANKAVLLATCEADQMFPSPPSFDNCFLYTKGRDIDGNGNIQINSNRAPESITCGNPFGDIWASDYQGMSCCSGDGRYYTATGQIGAFEFHYIDSDVETINPRCVGYTQSLTAITCSPNQGKYLQNNELRVCQSACDTVYTACGDPGDVLPGDARVSYNNGTIIDVRWTNGAELCQAAWHSMYHNDDTCSVGAPWSPWCNVSITVVDDVSDPSAECLSFIRPHFDISGDPNYDFQNYCPTGNDDNVDTSDLCLDIRNKMNNTRRRLANDACGNIPMYARSPASRESAIENGCFGASSNASENKTQNIFLSAIAMVLFCSLLFIVSLLICIGSGKKKKNEIKTATLWVTVISLIFHILNEGVLLIWYQDIKSDIIEDMLIFIILLPLTVHVWIFSIAIYSWLKIFWSASMTRTNEQIDAFRKKLIIITVLVTIIILSASLAISMIKNADFVSNFTDIFMIVVSITVLLTGIVTLIVGFTLTRFIVTSAKNAGTKYNTKIVCKLRYVGTIIFISFTLYAFVSLISVLYFALYTEYDYIFESIIKLSDMISIVAILYLYMTSNKDNERNQIAALRSSYKNSRVSMPKSTKIAPISDESHDPENGIIEESN